MMDRSEILYLAARLRDVADNDRLYTSGRETIYEAAALIETLQRMLQPLNERQENL